MDLALDEHEKMLQNSVRAFFKQELSPTLLRDLEASEQGYSIRLWGQMAELGWLGLPFPGDYGGEGGTLLQLAVLSEEIARVALPSPFFSTVILAGLTILNGGTEEQKQRLLSSIAHGDLIIALALLEPSGRYDPADVQTRADVRGDQYIIGSGKKLFVEYGHVADYLLCVARCGHFADSGDDLAIFLVPRKSEGLRLTLLPTIAGDKQCEVMLDSVSVPRTNLLGGVQHGWPAVEKTLQVATAVTCVQLAGIAQRALEMTVEYVKTRFQFGQPIGSFQAVWHHCANMAIYADGARLAAYEAVYRLSKGLPAKKHLSVAKAFCSRAARQVTLTAHQLHGGVGFMQEHPLQFYSRLAKALELRLGTPREHLQVVADAVFTEA